MGLACNSLIPLLQFCYTRCVQQMQIGEYMLKRRLELGLQQNDTAKAIAITPQSLCDIEGDRRKPRLDRVPAIALALDLAPDYLCYLLGHFPEAERTGARLGPEEFELRMKAFRAAKTLD